MSSKPHNPPLEPDDGALGNEWIAVERVLRERSKMSPDCFWSARGGSDGSEALEISGGWETLGESLIVEQLTNYNQCTGCIAVNLLKEYSFSFQHPVHLLVSSSQWPRDLLKPLFRPIR